MAVTTWHCYLCVRDDVPKETRDFREGEGLTITGGTLTCLEHVRMDVRSAEMAREAEINYNRSRRAAES